MASDCHCLLWCRSGVRFLPEAIICLSYKRNGRWNASPFPQRVTFSIPYFLTLLPYFFLLHFSVIVTYGWWFCGFLNANRQIECLINFFICDLNIYVVTFNKVKTTKISKPLSIFKFIKYNYSTLQELFKNLQIS